MKILQVPEDEAELRKVSALVTSIDQEVLDLISAMRSTLRDAGAIGLAAPQVGVHKRIIVWADGANPDGILHCLINPKVWSLEATRQTNTEGCLSVPGVMLDIVRAATIQVTGPFPTGRLGTMTLRGLEGACVQHEVEHLDGIMFHDGATEIHP